LRAVRECELQTEGEGRKSLVEVLKGSPPISAPRPTPSAWSLMDLLAVKECTDSRFLPSAFRSLDPEAVDKRIRELEMLVEGVAAKRRKCATA